ncbi:AMP-binding protein, partial [Corynebacterium bovis]|uniref:AMP-binding protein n=1 Tax=Corynebacterium bovis TaxID=36808 RepID=UPI000FBC12FE
VLNMYGITETTVHVTVHDLPAGHATGTSPVGRPLDGLTVHVLDDRLRPVGVGGTGVLYVAGAQVSRGYVGIGTVGDGLSGTVRGTVVCGTDGVLDCVIGGVVSGVVGGGRRRLRTPPRHRHRPRWGCGCAHR